MFSPASLMALGMPAALANELVNNQLLGGTGANLWTGTQNFTGATVVDPNNTTTIFGGGLAAFNAATPFATFNEEGNLYRIAGNPVGANAADTTDDILGGIQLPAGAFDVAGRALQILAQGTTGATTNNKRFKIFLNPTMTGQTLTAGVYSAAGHVTAGTAVVDSGTWVNGTTANNAAGWSATLTIQKYGAAGSNTQYTQGSPILGVLHGGINAAQFLTLTEANAINIIVTGASYTTGAANDVLLQMLQVNAMN